MSKAPGINDRRNGYLVSKALRTFMWASILAALAGQIATTTDAIVVSHLIGPDAISAVNLVMPVLTLCTCLGYLFGMGGAVVAAKAMDSDGTVLNESWEIMGTVFDLFEINKDVEASHDFHISFYVTPGSGQNEYFSRICMHISHPLCIYSGKKTQNIWNVLFIFLSLHRQ